MLEWTPEETSRLLGMLAAKQSRRDIAAAFGTSRSAISGKVYRLGLPLTHPHFAHHAKRRGKYADRS